MARRLVALAVAAVLLGWAPAAAQPGSADDPHRDLQWGLEQISAEPAWEIATGAGVTIAVVDSGVDLDHPDLKTKIVYYDDADFAEPEGRCTIKDGREVCIQDGAQDRNGHGTHVAGIAAAVTGNGVGIAGVAPDALILPVRVINREGEGTTRALASGIRFAADKGAAVINVSLTVDTNGTLLGRPAGVYAAIDYAWQSGSVVVVAAGNNSVPLCAEPSAHDLALCVGATDMNEIRAYYSNSDPTAAQWFLVAPGGDDLTCEREILSTFLHPGGVRSECSPEAGYTTKSGTSMAAPHVAGVAALLAQSGLTNEEIVDCLLATADDLGAPGRDSIYGYGRVNAESAVAGCTTP